MEEFLDFYSTSWGRSWFWRLADAYHMLGKYRKELKTIQQCRKHFPNSLLYVEARAYSALGRIDEVKNVIENSLAQSSQLEDPGIVMTNVSLELLEHGFFEAYKEMADQAVGWYESILSGKDVTRDLLEDFSVALYIAGRWSEAQSGFEQLSTEFPDTILYKGYLGSIAARIGEEERALEISEELGNINRPYLRGSHIYWRACIASLLGKKDQAVLLLREALSQGRSYGPRLLNDMDFEPLRGYKSFQDLIKPKG